MVSQIGTCKLACMSRVCVCARVVMYKRLYIYLYKQTPCLTLFYLIRLSSNPLHYRESNLCVAYSCQSRYVRTHTECMHAHAGALIYDLVCLFFIYERILVEIK